MINMRRVFPQTQRIIAGLLSKCEGACLSVAYPYGAYLYGVYLSVAVGYVGEDEVAGTIKEQQEKFDRMVDAYDRAIDRAMLSIKLREYQTDDERERAISKMIMNGNKHYVACLAEVVKRYYPGMVEFVEKVMLLV